MPFNLYRNSMPILFVKGLRAYLLQAFLSIHRSDSLAQLKQFYITNNIAAPETIAESLLLCSGVRKKRVFAVGAITQRVFRPSHRYFTEVEIQCIASLLKSYGHIMRSWTEAEFAAAKNELRMEISRAVDIISRRLTNSEIEATALVVHLNQNPQLEGLKSIEELATKEWLNCTHA